MKNLERQLPHCLCRLTAVIKADPLAIWGAALKSGGGQLPLAHAGYGPVNVQSNYLGKSNNCHYFHYKTLLQFDNKGFSKVSKF